MKPVATFSITIFSFILFIFISNPKLALALSMIPNTEENTITLASCDHKGKKLILSESATNRKTISRLRERVIVYLAFRTDQPQVYLLMDQVRPEQGFSPVQPFGKNQSTTFRFIIPPEKLKNWDTTYRFPSTPEWNQDWEDKLQNFGKKLRHELESQIQSIRFKENDDNFAYVVLKSRNRYIIQEVQLWVFTNNDWYPYKEINSKLQISNPK
jgi:hypothetical protein